MGKAAPPWKETSFGKEKVTRFFTRRISRKRDGKAKGRERQECRGRHLKDIQIQKEKSEEINKKL